MGLFSSRQKRYAECMAPQWLKIANDCAKIVNTTKNPKTFFERHDLLVEKLRALSELERYVKFSGQKPHAVLSDVLRRKSATIHDFIDRYYVETLSKINDLKTTKAKQNCAESFYNSLTLYSDRIDNENVRYYTDLYSWLLSMAGDR